jgi:rhodanese-related sulfurtransferase
VGTKRGALETIGTVLRGAVGLARNAVASAPETDAEKQKRIESLYQSYRRLGFQGVAEVEPDALSTLDSPVLVDVREPEERAVSMLPGAISQEQFEAEREAYRGRTVVAYCTIGARSGRYAKQLADEGWDARNLKGSVLAWTFTGAPFVSADGPTRRVHTYSEAWALTAEGYEPVW